MLSTQQDSSVVIGVPFKFNSKQVEENRKFKYSGGKTPPPSTVALLLRVTCSHLFPEPRFNLISIIISSGPRKKMTDSGFNAETLTGLNLKSGTKGSLTQN